MSYGAKTSLDYTYLFPVLGPIKLPVLTRTCSLSPFHLRLKSSKARKVLSDWEGDVDEQSTRDVIKVHVQRSQDAVRIDCSIYTLMYIRCDTNH